MFIYTMLYASRMLQPCVGSFSREKKIEKESGGWFKHVIWRVISLLVVAGVTIYGGRFE